MQSHTLQQLTYHHCLHEDHPSLHREKANNGGRGREVRREGRGEGTKERRERKGMKGEEGRGEGKRGGEKERGEGEGMKERRERKGMRGRGREEGGRGEGKRGGGNRDTGRKRVKRPSTTKKTYITCSSSDITSPPSWREGECPKSSPPSYERSGGRCSVLNE